MGKEKNDRRKKRRFRKFAFRLTLVLLFVALVLCTVIAYTPFSSSFLDGRIAKSWNRATGLDLVYKKGLFDLAHGRLILNDIQIRDTKEDKSVLNVGRLDLTWRWCFKRPSALFELKSVEISAPSALTLHLNPENNKLEPGPRFRSFIELFERLDERPREDRKSTAQPFDISIVDTALYLNSQDAGSTQTEHLAGIDSLKANFHYSESDAWSLRLTGRLLGEADEEGIRLSINQAGAKSKRDFSLNCAALDLKKHFRGFLPFSLSGRGLQVRGSLGPSNQPLDLEMTLTSPAMEIRPPLSGEALLTTPSLATKERKTQDTKMEIALKASLDIEKQAIQMRSLEVKALDSNMRAQGAITLEGTRPFNCEIFESSLSYEALNLLSDFFPDFFPDASFTRGTLKPAFQIVGDAEGIRWGGCEGSLRAENLKMLTPFLDHELGPLELSGALTSQSLKISNLDFHTGAGSNRLKISAAVFDRLSEHWREGLDVDLDWGLELDGEKFIEVLAKDLAPSLAEWKMRGTLTGYGKVRGEWTPMVGQDASPTSASVKIIAGKRRFSWLKQIESALQTLDVRGTFFIEEGRVFHPALPAPVDSLSGAVVLTNDTLVCSNLEGEMLGSKIAISGEATGKGLVWKKPVLNARIKGDVDLVRAPQVLLREALVGGWLEPKEIELLSRLQPQGRFGIDLTARGPLLEPDKLALAGKLSLENVLCPLDTPAVRGNLSVDEAVVVLGPERIDLERLNGHLNSISLSAKASIYKDHCEADYATTGTLPDYKTTFPPSLRDSNEVAGLARTKGHLDISLKPDDPLRGSSSPLLFFLALTNNKSLLEGARATSSTARLMRDRFEKRFEWDHLMTLDASDCLYTHFCMPVKVSHITGRFFLDREGFRTDGYVPMRWGAASDSLTSGSIRKIHLPPSQGPLDPTRKDYYRRITFAGRFPDSTLLLDEWITLWGSRRDPSRRPEWKSRVKSQDFDIKRVDQYEKKIEVVGTIETKEAFYKKLYFQNASAHFSTHIFRNNPAFIEVENFSGDFLKGKIKTDLSFLFRKPDFQWHCNLALWDILTEDLLRLLRDKEPTVFGTMTARLDIKGIRKERASFQGEGSLQIIDGRMSGNPIFSTMGELLSIDALKDTTFHQAGGDFKIENGVILIPKLALDSTLLRLVAKGKSDLNGELDLVVINQLLGILEGIPILGWLDKVTTFVGGKFLKIQIQGTVQKPEMKVMPLFREEVEGVFDFTKDAGKSLFNPNWDSTLFKPNKWIPSLLPKAPENK